MDVEDLLADALTQLGVKVGRTPAPGGKTTDFVLDPEGAAVVVQLMQRSLVNDDVARRLLAGSRPPGTALVVVGNRVTDTARRALTAGGAGYLDLRGRLAIRADGVVIEAEVAPVTSRPGRSQALSGQAGLEVATTILMNPERSVAVRLLSRELKRSASTVSEVLSVLRRDGLIDQKNTLVDTDLFGRVAENWPNRRVSLANTPMPGDAATTTSLGLGLENQERQDGWALTDSGAAAVYGAPVAFRMGQRLDFFVPSQAVVRRAVTLLGAATHTADALATVRVAPVPAAMNQRVDLDDNPTEWPLAHPLFVALDLAQDPGRGREILEAWTPDGWPRVW